MYTMKRTMCLQNFTEKCFGIIQLCSIVNTIYNDTISPGKDCKTSIEGLGYTGNLSITVNGRECQRWDSQIPHSYSYTKYFQGNVSMHENYCRNSKTSGSEGPWCYTMDINTRWEYCDIPICECKSTAKGSEYRGKISHTASGKECLRWDLSYEFMYPTNENSSLHENYCRNLKGVKDMPWCITESSAVHWEYCNIPLCFRKKDCKDTEQGMEYEGTLDRTREGISCQRWDSTYPHVPNRKLKFERSTMSAQENYCRNPDGASEPWCYTVDPDIRWQYCHVPFCLNATLQCYFAKGFCDVKQLNDVSMRWELREAGMVFRKNSSTERLFPTMAFPTLLPMKTGSCLELKYKSKGFQLMIATASQNLTILSESSEFKTAKVNIRPQPGNYQLFISPIPMSPYGSISVIEYLSVQDEPCKDCFACLGDGLCIENQGFCDMSKDCPDYSDEKNCALECYHEGKYIGFRKEAKSLRRCIETLLKTCTPAPELFGADLPGCFVSNHLEWEFCSIPECGSGSLNCDFNSDLCDWKEMQTGMKWKLQTSESSGERFAFSGGNIKFNGSMENKSVLYSAIQPASSDLGCITVTYSGTNIHFKVFITNGTIEDPSDLVFHQRNVDTNHFVSTSFQTPTDTPYMVIIVVDFLQKTPGIIRLSKTIYEKGICKDKSPCQKTEFQCDDGSCINVDQFCNKDIDCPTGEDEQSCQSSQPVCLLPKCSLPCPPTCKCRGAIFKCSTLTNVPKEARVLDLSSHTFQMWKLTNFSFLIHLNISRCFIKDDSLSNLGNHLQSYNLQNLDLAFNKIRYLQKKMFDGLPNLRYLNVSNNKMKILYLDFIEEVQKLRYLTIKNSGIEIIYGKTMNNQFNVSLEELDLRNNNIKEIKPKSLHWLGSLSKIILSNNSITNTDNYFSSSMETLFELDLSCNSIKRITNSMFSGLGRLRKLNLERNKIDRLGDFSFSTLVSLITLNLASNEIEMISRMAMENMRLLKKLNLTGNKLKTLPPTRFVALESLQILDLSDNGMRTLKFDAFKRLGEVKFLYIQNNELTVSKTMFQGLCNLEWLWTDSYIICCAKPLTVNDSNCISPRDRISSCEQLINVGFLAQMIWYMALFSLAGNLYVIYYRIRSTIDRSTTSPGMFILNLSISDFLMGLYLFIIAIADLEYRNIYGFNDENWRSSTMCNVAGLLATISSEASVLFIFLITFERFIAIKFPFSSGLLRKKKLNIGIALIVWITTIALAAVPLSIYPDFYSRSTVCISLPLTAERVHGWEYSTFVFIGFNLVILIAIVLGQILIFLEVRRIGKCVPRDTMKREISVFKSLSYVVLSDTCCWIPIILIGLLAHGGVTISSDAYAWVVVLVLPINAAFNPFIYTFSMIYKKQVCGQFLVTLNLFT
ncbi:uncharacterized protein LOC125668881 isoform X2 [Ostrea edulis]|uniref:uncharacterized protein LOC125668881 isoform X2 n=1 Tax=Ostrea edulis TaxID=37623 RepID=UPI0024AE995A|nr:uncharacterized protein LOC125668881 isoform X2 [Ostrea edulis]